MTPVVRRIIVWLVALGMIAGTVSLGMWQTRRAEQKHRAEAMLVKRKNLPPWGNEHWPCPGDVPDELPVQRPVALRGYWLADRTVLLDNRPMDGVSGFIVVTPLLLSPTAHGCKDGIVLVARGWIPRDPHDRLKIPALHTPSDEVHLEGRLVAGLSQSYQLGQEESPDKLKAPIIRQNAEPAFWVDWLGQAPLVGALQQMQPAEPDDEPELLRNWVEPGMGEDRHKAYAFQWFVMAGVIAALTIWFLVIRPLLSSSSKAF